MLYLLIFSTTSLITYFKVFRALSGKFVQNVVNIFSVNNLLNLAHEFYLSLWLLEEICISPSAGLSFNDHMPQYKNAFQIKYTSIAKEGPNGFGNCHWQQFI